MVGANGAGKSTLLKLMNGELEATSGMIRIITYHLNLMHSSVFNKGWAYIVSEPERGLVLDLYV